jgi:aryl-alcohol dehydrogenase-like predicted oxidoreductase/rhodanese-related sulfurtransferase
MTVDDLLAAARARLDRVDPRQAAEEQQAGALLIDIRPSEQRRREGTIPGARVMERNVLEWRLDPTSQWRIPEAQNHDVRVIILCSEGYTSSLAAAALQDLGLTNATDLAGGFCAWQQAAYRRRRANDSSALTQLPAPFHAGGRPVTTRLDCMIERVTAFEETGIRHRPLGVTGMHVSTYCLGTMMFGAVGNPDHNECIRIVHAALDSGINFVDTADMYSDGESEVIVGKALAMRRDEVILATKGHFPMGEGVNRGGNSRRWLRIAVEDSLRRLKTDWIDLYQVHRPDPDTDIAETLDALTDLVRAGKIRAFGASTFPADLIVAAQEAADRRGLLPLRTEQPPYSLLARGIEAAVLPVCQRYGMGVMVWSPLASGFLSGRIQRDRDVSETMNRPRVQPERFDLSRPQNQVKLEAVDRFSEVASDFGCTLAELALAFTLSHPGVTAAIIGPRTLDQLKATLAGSRVNLDDATLDRIDAIVAPGTNLTTDGLWRAPALDQPLLRRRASSQRSAAEARKPDE